MLATPTSFGSHGSRSLETGEGTRGFLEIKKRDKISVFFFLFFSFSFFFRCMRIFMMGIEICQFLTTSESTTFEIWEENKGFFEN